MMSTQHTPGPWEIQIEEHLQIYIASVGQFFICADPDDIECNRDAMLADAQLIAAAPDLLAACEEAVPVIATMIDRILQIQVWVRASAPKEVAEGVDAIVAELYETLEENDHNGIGVRLQDAIQKATGEYND